MVATGARRPIGADESFDPGGLTARIGQILNRRPAVGLAVGVVRHGRLEFFHGHGVANVGAGTPVTQDTVFRIASITKLFTAVAVMQLWEQGMVDLDAPANAYLRGYQLIPADSSFRPATLRHLLTHTAGVPEVLHLADLLHPSWGPFDARPAALSVGPGDPLPSPAECYRSGLRIAVDPGSAFTYTNHGFATLGQVVEDVSGQPLHRYFRERLFEPLGMADTYLLRSEGMASRPAIGYALGPGGAREVADREWVTGGASNIRSTTRDLGCFVAALLGGGANEHGSILLRATLATMFEPHYQPDPRMAGMGLGFFRVGCGGRPALEHLGVLPGFHSHLIVAPHDGVGVIALTNGSSAAYVWLPIELRGLLCHLLGVPDDAVRLDVPHRPEIWGELCGRYQLPERVSDLRGRMTMGGGAQVFVHGGRLMLRVLTPIPALFRGLPLHPDDPDDPYVFRLDLSEFGMATVRLVFAGRPGAAATAIHTDLGLQPLSMFRRHGRHEEAHR